MLVQVRVSRDEDGVWCASAVDHGIHTQGPTLDELYANIEEATQLHFEEELAAGRTAIEYHPTVEARRQLRCNLLIMYKIEIEQEEDGRWIAEVADLPGVLTYGQTREEAIRKAQALSLRVLAERLDNGEPLPQVQAVFSIVA